MSGGGGFSSKWVYLVLGQKGITGGAGAVAANTPRITHASDDPAVTALQLIDNIVSGSGANISQINGVTPLMGLGASGTGSPRITSASDSPDVTSLQLLDDVVATTASPIPTKGFAVSGTDGTNARVLKTDSSGELQIDVLTMPAVTISGTVDTELPAAAALADGTANPTVPGVGSYLMLLNTSSTWDKARAATLFDLDTSGSTQNVMGVTLRTPASGGSIELLPTSAALSDSITNPTTTQIGAATEFYNGSTWERALAIRNATNSTGVGISMAGMVAQLDDTSPTAITENQFGNVTMSPRRGVNVEYITSSRSDTYTTTANGTAIDLGARSACKYFSIQVVQTGTVTAWDVRLEGSLDGTNYSQIVAHTNADGTGIVKASIVFPVRYFRSRCAGLTLGAGTNVVVSILGVN